MRETGRFARRAAFAEGGGGSERGTRAEDIHNRPQVSYVMTYYMIL